MQRSYPLVEIHYAIWAVLTVPLGFAGLFFLIPGLILEVGIPLLAIAALLLAYVGKLTQFKRRAWLLGLALHAIVLVAGVYYLPRWPQLLSVPLMAINVYSLVVLVVYRRLWAASPQLPAQPA
ncbi:MAG: hypothetical protein JSU87_10555 [Gemmatimonadota bacterium]|nr:MAG: hypothetical protein JSU87_10555 [Gemmatimonadota bacterium]